MSKPVDTVRRDTEKENEKKMRIIQCNFNMHACPPLRRIFNRIIVIKFCHKKLKMGFCIRFVPCL